MITHKKKFRLDKELFDIDKPVAIKKQNNKM